MSAKAEIRTTIDETAAVDGFGNNEIDTSDSLGPTDSTPTPRITDVLVGRGLPFQNFRGNKRMLDIVSQYKEEYRSRPRDKKKAFVKTVLEAVLKDGNTRFLRLVRETDKADHWEEVSRSVALEKVWHALRSKDGQGKKRKEKQKAARERVIPSSRSEATTQRSNLPGGEEVLGSATASGFLPPQQSLMTTIPSVQTLLRQIHYHLENATAATNILASFLHAPPQQISSPIGLSGIPAETTAATSLAQQAISLTATLLNQGLLRVPAAATEPTQAPNPTISANIPSTMPAMAFPTYYVDNLSFQQQGAATGNILAPYPFPPTAPAWQPSPTGQQQQGAQFEDQSQALRQALVSLMQAAQQAAGSERG